MATIGIERWPVVRVGVLGHNTLNGILWPTTTNNALIRIENLNQTQHYDEVCRFAPIEDSAFYGRTKTNNATFRLQRSVFERSRARHELQLLVVWKLVRWDKGVNGNAV